MKTSLVILALNEIDGMRVNLPRIRREWVDEIIFIDGHSTDGSFEYAQSMGYSCHRQREPGVIPAWIEGVERSTGDVVIMFSPDNNSVPERLPELVAKMKEGYDMVVVSRYLDGARSTDDTRLTGFGNWMFTTLVNVLFRTRYTDLLVIYRAFRKNLYSELDIVPGKAINTQLAIRCAKRGKKVGEIPGDEPARLGGIPKRSIIINGTMELVTILQEFVFYWR